MVTKESVLLQGEDDGVRYPISLMNREKSRGPLAPGHLRDSRRHPTPCADWCR